MKKKRASTTIYIIFFFIMFLAFSAFAVDASIIFGQRVKLQGITEQAALASAAYLNYDPTQSDNQVIIDEVQAYGEKVFNLLKQDSLEYAKATITVSYPAPKQVSISSSVIAQPFFLAFLGVSGVNLKAKATAQSSTAEVMSDYGGVKWLTPTAVYLSSIISDVASADDTAIVTPLGKFSLASLGDADIPDFSLINKNSDSQGLSLGPGGHITLRLPAPIIDKDGPDLYIREAGAAKDGYMVFAGLDIDTADTTDNSQNTGPYIKSDRPGAGIKWVNISCTAKSTEDIASATTINSDGNSVVYGSANFDIGASCASTGFNGVSMVKYIRIIDDNNESAYFKNEYDGKFNQTMILGDSSCATAGADISQVNVLNFVQLVKP